MDDKLTPEQTRQITEALLNKRKIEAIKLYREASGQGLKEAKESVEAFAQKLAEQDPVKYGDLAAAGGGCTSMILLCLGLGLIAGHLVKTIG